MTRTEQIYRLHELMRHSHRPAPLGRFRESVAASHTTIKRHAQLLVESVPYRSEIREYGKAADGKGLHPISLIGLVDSAPYGPLQTAQNPRPSAHG